MPSWSNKSILLLKKWEDVNGMKNIFFLLFVTHFFLFVLHIWYLITRLSIMLLFFNCKIIQVVLFWTQIGPLVTIPPIGWWMSVPPFVATLMPRAAPFMVFAVLASLHLWGNSFRKGQIVSAKAQKHSGLFTVSTHDFKKL